MEDKIVLPSSAAQFVKLNLGTKVQCSSYNGFDYLPSIRLGWKLTDTGFLWGAISARPVAPRPGSGRAASPGEAGRLRGRLSRAAHAADLGVGIDLLESVHRPAHAGLHRQQGDAVSAGNTYGLEAWGDWRVLPWWKLSAGVNLMHEDLHVAPVPTPGTIPVATIPATNSCFRSFMDLPHNVQFDFGLQVVDRLPDPVVEGYVQARGADRLASDARNRAFPRGQQPARRAPCGNRRWPAPCRSRNSAASIQACAGNTDDVPARALAILVSPGRVDSRGVADRVRHPRRRAHAGGSARICRQGDLSPQVRAIRRMAQPGGGISRRCIHRLRRWRRSAGRRARSRGEWPTGRWTPDRGPPPCHGDRQSRLRGAIRNRLRSRAGRRRSSPRCTVRRF